VNRTRRHLLRILLSALVIVGGSAAVVLGPSAAFAAGGCAGKYYARNNDPSGYASAGVDSCVSSDDIKYSADSYVTFTSSSSPQWEYCQLTISVFDQNASRVLAQQTYDCLGQARANAGNAHFGVVTYQGPSCPFEGHTSMYGHQLTAHVYFTGGWRNLTLGTGLLQSPATPYGC
jgi:hypothetical protein